MAMEIGKSILDIRISWQTQTARQRPLMTTHDRYKLLSGPYRAPSFRYGQTMLCEVRGELIVRGLSAGRIPWPLGIKKGERNRSLVVTGGLVEAVKRESNIAVAYWWGVNANTVTKWRKALGIGLSNEGTQRLRHDYAQEPGVRRGLKKALKKSLEPKVRAKIGSYHRGKVLSRQTRKKISAARKGRKLSPEHRRRIGQGLRQGGILPVWVTRPWTPAEDRLVRTLPPAEVVRRIGRTLSAVAHRRVKLGVSRKRGDNDGGPG